MYSFKSNKNLINIRYFKQHWYGLIIHVVLLLAVTVIKLPLLGNPTLVPCCSFRFLS